MAGGEPIPDGDFRRLHPATIELRAEIRELLERAREEQVEFRRGLNRRIAPEIAKIESLGPDDLVLQTRDFDPKGATDQIFLNFSLDGEPYFFAAKATASMKGGRLRVRVPTQIHRSERRDHTRVLYPDPSAGDVQISRADGLTLGGRIEDISPGGLGVAIRDPDSLSPGTKVLLRLPEPMERTGPLFGEVRNRRLLTDRAGWTRIGIDVSAYRPDSGLTVERRDVIYPLGPLERAAQRFRILTAGVGVAGSRAAEQLRLRRKELPEVSVRDILNSQGERIRAIVDTWGETRGAPAIIIPPAWGRTKETTLPLAACLLAAFRRAKQPVVIVRFDGIRKRGESFKDPECAQTGKDHHRFTFSQGVRDIRAVIDDFVADPAFAPSKVALVSFSAASIESRRAVATDERIHGWVSVVGAPDLQSMMRVISGGVDFAAGLEKGMRFGIQEILGFEVDMDYAGLDAFQHRLTYLEDARRDMAAISAPVTWISGRYDAWMDRERVRDILSRGDATNRRLIEVPTGHMLSTSSEALETFQLVAAEVSEMLLGRPVPRALPDLSDLAKRSQAERARLPTRQIDLHAFWRDYLIGSDAALSFELMTSISPYEDLMKCQVEGLDLRAGDVVVDLGSGTGAFPRYLAAKNGPSAHVIAIDYVREGLIRGRAALASDEARQHVCFLEANLDPSDGSAGLPLRSQAADSVLASLLLSYVRKPAVLLREAYRVLRPGGRLVVSTLCRDADMSKLYRDGLQELRAGRACEVLPSISSDEIERSARAYLNEASRLLDLEEAGVFRFMDPEELGALVRSVGFSEVTTVRSLGNPSQAVVVSAVRL